MVTGMAVSRLIDKPNEAMSFDLEELEAEECQSYVRLTHVIDSFRPIEDLLLESITGKKENSNLLKIVQRSASSVPEAPTIPGSKIATIEELSEEDMDDGEDMVPYDKPDTDASDSEDDPTLVQRSKPTKPVFVAFALFTIYKEIFPMSSLLTQMLVISGTC
jgi:telomere length regulation protein